MPVACPIPFDLDAEAERVRNHGVALLDRVLADRGAGGPVSHASHEVGEAGTGASGKRVAGVAKVVEVEAAGEPGLGDGRRPPGLGLEAGATQECAFGSGEDQGGGFVRDVVPKMKPDVIPDRARDADSPLAGTALGRPELGRAVGQRDECGTHGQGAEIVGQVTASQCGKPHL